MPLNAKLCGIYNRFYARILCPGIAALRALRETKVLPAPNFILHLPQTSKISYLVQLSNKGFQFRHKMLSACVAKSDGKSVSFPLGNPTSFTELSRRFQNYMYTVYTASRNL